MTHQEHQQQADAQAAERPPIRCGVLTISDTRTAANDTSGSTIRAALQQAGHDVVEYDIVKDDASAIVATVQAYAGRNCQVIITNGGTGITRRDTTFEAIDSLLEKRLPGFGELFRMLSYQEIGAAAMLSRATAGLYQHAIIFALPGSTGAVRTALDQLILPELHHLVWETIRQ